MAAIVAVLSLVAAACGGDDNADATTSTDSEDQGGIEVPDDALNTPQTLIAGNSPVYPPMSYLPDGSEDPADRQGFDVDLARAIGEKLGLTVEFETQPYEQYIPSLGTGRIDVIHSAMQDLPERRETVVFIDYYTTGPQMYTMAERETDFPNEESVCGAKVAVDSGDAGYRDALTSFSETVCEPAGLEAIEQVLTDSTPDALLQLEQGRVDVGILGAESIRYIASEQRPGDFYIIGGPIAEIPVGIGVAVENTALRDAIAAALGELMADGTYQEIGDKWGLTDILRSSVTINGGAGN